MEIHGYLESGGLITKVSSIEDIKNFIARCGQSINEMTEMELDKMASFEQSNGWLPYDYMDDCGALYKTNPLIFLSGTAVVLRHMNSYKILEGVVSINKNAFSHPDNKDRLRSVYMPDTVIVIGDSAFFGRNKLSSLSLSKALLKIGNYAFRGCLSLIALSPLPVLKYIGSHAFENSGLESITIPSSTIKIGSCAFCNCQGLTSVIFEGMPSNIGSGIFDRCVSLANVYVPHGSLDYFAKALYPLDKSIIKEM